MAHSAVTRRSRIWLALLIGWLPVWALYTLLASPANPLHRDALVGNAALSGLIAVVIAALLGLGVQRLTDRVPWPHPFRSGFLGVHLLAATAYSVAWVTLKGTVEILIHRQSAAAFHFMLHPNLVLGVWLYAMVAGVAYSVQATERAARAETNAARSQLAALRGQLNPHFLFNALHTVVQLIPREPAQASRAAEQIAGLLRTTIEEDRDLVAVAEEVEFVERYLALERLRFGDRLRVTVEVSADAASALMPAFALQTLVENAVRHGAAPRIEPTDIAIRGAWSAGVLTLLVSDTGAGIEPTAAPGGTGLARLRDRLAVLYGSAAALEVRNGTFGGVIASLTIPQAAGPAG